jgi:hypothetical protein
MYRFGVITCAGLGSTRCHVTEPAGALVLSETKTRPAPVATHIEPTLLAVR